MVLAVLRRGKDSNPFKCGADEHRRRGLDRADPLFSLAAARENANESVLPVIIFFWLVAQYEETRLPFLPVGRRISCSYYLQRRRNECTINEVQELSLYEKLWILQVGLNGRIILKAQIVVRSA